MKVHIRWLISRDYPEVLDIEVSGDRGWNEEDFLRCLRQRNCIGMIAEHGEKVVGFMIYALHKNKLELLNFVVHPQWRHCGVGRQMIEKLVSKLSSHRRTKISVAVHEANLGLQLFLREMGFVAEYCAGKFYVMVRKLSDDVSDEPPNRIAAYFSDKE